MQRSTRFLFVLGMPLLVAASGALAATPEEVPAVQDLVNVKAARPIQSAQWIRQADAYILRLEFDTNAIPARQRATPTGNPDPRPINATPPPPPNGGSTPDSARFDRASFFIGNTIANLRGMDPVFGCRTLTLVDGRRVVTTQQQAQVPPPAPTPRSQPGLNQPWPPRVKESRIDAWLLKSDGTQILPVLYSCDAEQPPASGSWIEYRFTLTDGAQAVAAAIRIVDDFYIDNLRR